MSFFLETTEMDLGDTAIENIFINDYMPMANGTYVKVYLLGFKYASDKEKKMEVNNEVLAKHLQIPLSDVLNAWTYWEEKGVIEKIHREDEYNYGINFLSLKQLYIQNTYGAQYSNGLEKLDNVVELKSEEIFQFGKEKENRKMFNDIDDIMGQSLSMDERAQVIDWIEKTDMERDVIKQAFQQTKDRGVLAFNYTKKIVIDWFNRGIKTVEDVAEHYETNNRRYYQYDKIMKSLGHLGAITDGQKQMIDKWIDEYEFSMEVILEGCLMAGKGPNMSPNYLETIFKNWYDEGVRTVQDAKNVSETRSEKQKEERVKTYATNKRTHDVSNRFHNFEQRTDSYTEDELEEVARRKREQYIRELKGEA